MQNSSHYLARAKRASMILSLAAAAVALPSVAHAQADQFQFYFNQATATGGAPIAGFGVNPNVDTFYTGGFNNAAQALRKITLSGGVWTGQVQVGQTDWVNKFLKSTSVTDNGGNGTILDSSYTVSGLLGDIQLNPQAVTIAGVNYPANTVAVIIDSSRTTLSAGSVLQPASSKQIYAWDLRQVTTLAGTNSGRDRNANTIVDWNDVFDPILSLADIQAKQPGTTAASTNNLSRRFAFSSNGQAVYFADSSTGNASFGGVWKLDLATGGSAGLTKVVDSRSSGTSIITEPTVVHTSVRDFGGGAGAGDQVFFRGSTDTGNIGGLNYVVDNGASVSTPKVAISAKQMAAFLDVTGGSGDVTSITSDSSGNLYFYTNGSTSVVTLYDTQGRLAKISSEAEKRLFAKQRTATYNASILDTKVRNVNVTLSNATTVSLPQVLYSDAGAGLVAPIGITVYKPGDFNRDNVVDVADATALKGKLGLRGAIVASIATATPFAEVNSGDFKYDLNGSNTTTGINGLAIDWKDVKIFQQFAGLSDGDVDMDFDVDTADLTTVATNYNTDGKLFTQGNLTSVRIANADKDAVNYADMVTLAANWTAANPNLSGFSAAVQADGDRAFALTAGGSRHQYIARGSGAWSNAANWSGGVPNSAGAVASLLTKPQDDVTLDVDGVFTLGQLNFDNFFNYTLTGGGALLFTGNNGTKAEINTFAASPTISASVSIVSNTDATVTYATDTLTLSGALTTGAGRTLNKLGPGKLVISGTQFHAAGATLAVNGGVVDLNSNAGSGGANLSLTTATGTSANFNASQSMANITNNGALNVNAGNSVVGTVDGTGNTSVATPATIAAVRYRQNTLSVNGTASVIANGSSSSLSIVDQLVIFGSGKLDLNDNDLVVNSSTYAAITGEIASARSAGAWDGPGITSTAAKNATPKNKTLGTLTGAEFHTAQGAGALFDGTAVLDTDVLVKFTYYGDVDFNGLVDFDDYSRIDAGFNNNRTGWFNGDVDYNGIVDFDDYSLIDQAFNTQSGTLRRAMSYLNGSDRSDAGMDTPALQLVMEHLGQFGEQYAAGFLASVPEPTSALALSGLAALAASSRRRRRRN